MLSTEDAHIVLASGSLTRKTLLENAALVVAVCPAKVDEELLRAGLLAEGAAPRDIADALAEQKARKVAFRFPSSLVLGCDQVLQHEKTCLAKAGSPGEAFDQLKRLRNDRHTLLSAAVIYENAVPVWRHIGVAHLRMRDATDEYLEDYVSRNWHNIRHSVGGYKLEEEGVRLFSSIEGDYFTILGLPLLQILNYLTTRGIISG
ncbi:septum formation protein [Poseidonocella pacifica]|uniref:Nucleoside triphosphate pyrophosphatase n=1 Tax=Poseidonocella pacifica TaxID=871651 RepID=A0A1I0XUU9_9RHOB|nr:Maf family protein [Poseidonocella pacifica]SFB04704.1 septum formation protein [Poseidonocella pacifica]